MEPFQLLLNSTENLQLDQSLQDAFEAAKVETVDQVKFGVTTYVTGKPTALASDWSKTDVGYVETL